MILDEYALSQKIRKAREMRNYTQSYMAQELEISTRAYSKLESGETRLSVKRLYQIAELLETSVYEFLLLDKADLRALKLKSSANNTDASSQNGILELKALLEKLLEDEA
ncbi:helix-turn-helix domain-containing protein [Croceimicrobium hydrocarbonivorans]|uniref:Helix-turn-helix transcriptional regulator n=1 Tax=Croceimicrobium hydrocarbonivorans TaxID=2761580 RepID=A0A7H0VJN6_9FLAO|nr:helix-turn-helix transcriptional regulator [Croceimicrobium hydrocarbonivorans]QNR25934.1 helix-turn-helix transcriptional regulator [Croceimicrobium hydrocarbonivorans]